MTSIRALGNGSATIDAIRAAVSGPGFLLLRSDRVPHFPAVCPACGEPASTSLSIERSFRIHVHGEGDSPSETRSFVERFDVPFCGECVRRHSAEHALPGVSVAVWRIVSDGEGLGALIALGVGVMFLYHSVRTLSLVLLVFTMLPLSVAWWLLRNVWNRSRHMGVPKPTAVDQAVDFTADLSLELEPPWRAWQFQSAEYAERFRVANVELLWNPAGAEARSAAEGRRKESARSNLIVGAVVVLILLWWAWDSFVSR